MVQLHITIIINIIISIWPASQKNVIDWKGTIYSYIIYAGKFTSVTNLSFKIYDVINVVLKMQLLCFC